MGSTGASTGSPSFLRNRAGILDSRCVRGARHKAGIFDLVSSKFHDVCGDGGGVGGLFDGKVKKKQMGEREKDCGGAEVETGC